MKYAHLWKQVLHNGLGKSGSVAKSNDEIAASIITAPIIVGPIVGDDVEGEPLAWPKYRIVCPFNCFWVERKIDESHMGFLVNKERSTGDILNYSVFNVVNAHNVPAFIFAAFTFGISVGDGGSLQLEADGTFLTKCKYEPSLSALGYTATQIETSVLTHAALLFDVLNLLNCKNVSLEPRENDAKQVRIATKRHGPAWTGYRYHVLTVRPASAAKDSPAIEIGTMPRHMCRGHFAEYGPEFGKGMLFGRLSGRFFIPPHMKGKKENGTVEKDYQVEVTR